MIKKILFVSLKIAGVTRVMLFFMFIVLRVPYQPVVLHSERFMTFISRVGGFTPNLAKAAAIFPFVILRFQGHEMNTVRIQHETTHHYQQLETAGLIQLYAQFEYLYARHRLGYNHMQAYLYKCTEQEAYLHQEDPNYLLTRKRFGFLSHIKNKTKFELVDFRVSLIP